MGAILQLTLAGLATSDQLQKAFLIKLTTVCIFDKHSSVK
jgi:hypothetical protein